MLKLESLNQLYEKLKGDLILLIHYVILAYNCVENGWKAHSHSNTSHPHVLLAAFSACLDYFDHLHYLYYHCLDCL